MLHSLQWNPIRIGEGYYLEPDGQVAVNPSATISEDWIERALALMDVMAGDDTSENAAPDRYVDAISDLIVAKYGRRRGVACEYGVPGFDLAIERMPSRAPAQGCQLSSPMP